MGRTVERFGALGVLVNNTGINPQYGPLVGAALEAGRKYIDAQVVDEDLGRAVGL